MNAPGSPPFPEGIPRGLRFSRKTAGSGAHRRWLPWVSASLLVLGSLTAVRPIRAAESAVAPPARRTNDVSTGAPPSTEAEPPVVLPPWVVTESLERPLQSARADYFASTLGPTSVVTASDWSGRGVTTLAAALRGVTIKHEAHVDFKKRVPGAIGLIRTGDTVQYANMILISG